MAKRTTKKETAKRRVNNPNVIGLHSEVIEQPITQTLEVNYMPYAMSTNVSRAFPEIDGFKPSHRKLLYTMYKMGLLTGARQKSANIVGQTMKLNPHGDAAIYETMVRLATGNEALLTPFVDSKGNFGKYYSGPLTCCGKRRFSTFPQITLIRFFFRLSLCTRKLPKASETCQLFGFTLHEGALGLRSPNITGGHA